MTPFIQGLIIGFGLAVPIGPIGILCIKRSLIAGTRGGFVVGLSGATADVLFALAAALGLSLIIDFINAQQLWMRLFGGSILLVAGFHLLRNRPAAQQSQTWERTETRAFLSVFILALTNPLTLFGFIAAFTTIGLNRLPSDAGRITLLVTGVFFGSFCWFSLLTVLARQFRQKLAGRGISIINKCAGALLMLFGAVGVVLALRSL